MGFVKVMFRKDASFFEEGVLSIEQLNVCARKTFRYT